MPQQEPKQQLQLSWPKSANSAKCRSKSSPFLQPTPTFLISAGCVKGKTLVFQRISWHLSQELIMRLFQTISNNLSETISMPTLLLFFCSYHDNCYSMTSTLINAPKEETKSKWTSRINSLFHFCTKKTKRRWRVKKRKARGFFSFATGMQCWGRWWESWSCILIILIILIFQNVVLWPMQREYSFQWQKTSLLWWKEG